MQNEISPRNMKDMDESPRKNDDMFDQEVNPFGEVSHTHPLNQSIDFGRTSGIGKGVGSNRTSNMHEQK